MLGGGSVEIYNKEFYTGSLRVKLTLACQEMLELSWVLNEPKKVTFHSDSNTTSEHAPSQGGKQLLILYAKQPVTNHAGRTPDQKSH